MTMWWRLVGVASVLCSACGTEGVAVEDDRIAADATALDASIDQPSGDGGTTKSASEAGPKEPVVDAGPKDPVVDAAAADSGKCGAVLVGREANAVACGALTCAITNPGIDTCTATMQGAVVASPFCYTGQSAPPPGNPNGGNISASCDGPEDCSVGQVCRDQTPGDGVLDTKCGARSAGVKELCHDHTDCGSGALCCTAMTFQSGQAIRTPYGVCSPADTIPTDARCDCP